MALIPKTDSLLMKNLRPIMLLETTRKLWLAILANRMMSVIDAHQLLHPAQTGCSPNKGTEDSILAVLNCLEDAHERHEELHLLSFDTSKAFDSPPRFSGLYLAWRRIGLSHDDALYIVNCDTHNVISPKTTYSLLHPTSAETFQAQCGTPQGDSLAGHQWKVFADIAVTVISKAKTSWDRYQYRDHYGILRSSEPIVFVDDMNAISHTIEGCQRLLEIQEALALVLNLNLNAKKTWHMQIKFDSHGQLIPITDASDHPSLPFTHPITNKTD
jgi:hypothetical protein